MTGVTWDVAVPGPFRSCQGQRASTRSHRKRPGSGTRKFGTHPGERRARPQSPAEPRRGVQLATEHAGVDVERLRPLEDEDEVVDAVVEDVRAQLPAASGVGQPHVDLAVALLRQVETRVARDLQGLGRQLRPTERDEAALATRQFGLGAQETTAPDLHAL